MKSLLLASVTATAAIAAAGAANAADMRMPTKAPVLAPAPVSAWSGCYLGGHVGQANARTTWTDTAGSAALDPSLARRSVETDMSGQLYGGQLGCDVQIGGPLVFGIEGALSGTNLDDGHTNPFNSAWTLQTSHDWIAAVTGRVGLGFSNALIYARGGLAWADTQYQIHNAGILVGDPSKRRQGWVVGGGIEYAFTPAWSIFVEGDYYSFRATNVSFAGEAINPTPAFTISSKENIEAIKLGVNYRFGNMLGGRAF
jgi:outer membrane immunogenic protein